MPKSKVGYVDGFVLIVPKKQVARYRKMARDAGKVWMKHGALGFKECMLEDTDPMPEQKYILFPQLAKAKKGDTVWFSYIEYKSKKHRNQVNAKVMKDPFMQIDDPNHMDNMPFDMKRFAYGGFQVKVDG